MLDQNSNHQENDKQIDHFNYLPFNIHWLDSSYQQTCLPESAWQKILDDLEPALANRIRQQFNNPQRRQIIIELLGFQYQSKLFRSEPDIPYILNPPYMLEEHRHKLENEAKSWLQVQSLKAAMEIGAAVSEDEDTHHLSNAMKTFLEDTYEIVSKALERYLYQMEQQEARKQEEETLQEIYKKKYQIELTGRAKLRSILRDAKTNSRKLPMINESTSTPDPMTSQYSDVISNSVIALLKRDLRRVIFLQEKLFGQQLPKLLRQFVWAECLFRFERTSFDYDLSLVEYQTRRDFAAGVRRGKNELNLNNPSNSPVTNLIENAVIEIYSQVPALHPYLEENHLRLTIKILNVLYTYKKEYESYFIYWLLPFQLSYNDEINKDEEIYVIAMHVDLYHRHCFPPWSTVFTIASRIMLDVSINDQEFYHHLKTISKIRANINRKDFVKEIISLENRYIRPTIEYPDELLSDPILFLRKWISQMFVGILHSNAVLYFWDQFFLTKWDTDYIEHATKAIFYLLRDRLMCATDYEQMRKVFLDEPCRLYTTDIQTAFVHLALKYDQAKYIPAMNRRFYPLKPIVLKSDQRYSERIGIKNISLDLVIPLKNDLQQEFKYKTLIVEIQVYQDGEKLDSMSTKTVPVIRGKDHIIHDWQKISFDIPNDKLILSIKNTRPSFPPTRIQALVILHQRFDVVTLKTLAYCRFPLYIPQKIGHLDTWDVTSGTVKRALHPGIPPFSIDIIPDIPKFFTAEFDQQFIRPYLMIIFQMSNIFLIKFLTIIRLSLWYFGIITCLMTRTVFLIQTWSKIFVLILIFNLLSLLINFLVCKHRRYYPKLEDILVIALPLLTLSTMIIYIRYLFDIYYRIMNLLIINIMTNNHYDGLLSITLNYYQCCRIQDEILFDSVNERDYFLLFPYCQKVIIENELEKDHWNNITPCGTIFKSMIFYIRVFFLLDLLFNIIYMIRSLIYLCEENDEWVDEKRSMVLKTIHMGYKIK